MKNVIENVTELSDLTEFWNVHGNPVYYRVHGRVYKSPHKPKEIWFTIGLGFRNAQIYPDFEPWMRAFSTEEQYNEFTKFLEREFDESPSEQSTAGQVCSLLSFMLTMGICFCCFLYYFYARRRLRSFRARTVTLFNNKTKSMGLHNVHLNFTSSINEDDENCWADSKCNGHLQILVNNLQLTPFTRMQYFRSTISDKILCIK